jgi:uncharacterized membrane protein (DUF2068 family)
MEKNHKYGLRTVATIEASKGLVVIALCAALLSLLNRDLSTLVDQLTTWLRLDSDSRIANWFYNLAERTTGRGIWTAVGVGLAYATCRFVEAYGLWRQRHWAEWFAVISGAIYVPFEFYALVTHPDWKVLALLAVNLIVVFYVASILVENRRARLAAAAEYESRPSGLAD